MVELKFAVAETPLGAFGVAWSDIGITRTWMHAGSVALTREQIHRAYAGAIEAPPPPGVQNAIDATVALLGGEPRDLGFVQLDMRGVPELDQRAYAVARTIGAGSTMTYGEVARELGEDPRLAREVGIAMARNRFAPVVPCHRVVAAGGKLGGYSAPGGAATKRRLLELEHAAIVTDEVRQLGLF